MKIDFAPLDRHERVALSFSGGKDSLACVYLLRDHWDRITLYHNDTGDLLPETRDVVSQIKAMVPNFVHIQSDARAWIAQYGMPTDLLPYSAHEYGHGYGQNNAKIVTRYNCCFVNLMWPLWNRAKEDGNTLLIRGTKVADFRKLPAYSGEVHEGTELWYPIQDWSHADVFAYLRSVGAPTNRIYDYVQNAPDCARCTAWWGEGRAAYLKRFHPELHADYMAGLSVVAGEITESVANLRRELAEVG